MDAVTLVLALLVSNAQPQLPPAFHGTWGVGAAACSDPDGVNRVAVTARGLQFYEARGQVIEVQHVANGGLDAVMSFEGEGRTWRQRLQLRSSGDRLTIVDPESKRPGQGLGGDFIRC